MGGYLLCGKLNMSYIGFHCCQELIRGYIGKTAIQVGPTVDSTLVPSDDSCYQPAMLFAVESDSLIVVTSSEIGVFGTWHINICSKLQVPVWKWHQVLDSRSLVLTETVCKVQVTPSATIKTASLLLGPLQGTEKKPCGMEIAVRWGKWQNYLCLPLSTNKQLLLYCNTSAKFSDDARARWDIFIFLSSLQLLCPVIFCLQVMWPTECLFSIAGG